MLFHRFLIPTLILILLVVSGPGCPAADDNAASLLQAAEAAYAQNSFEKAIEAWTAAAGKLDAKANPATLAKVYAGIGSACLKLSDYPRAQKSFALAGDLYANAADLAGKAACITGLAEVAFQQGNFDKSTSLHNEALALRDGLHDDIGKAADYIGLAQICSKRGWRREAVDTYTEALKIFVAANSSEGIASAVSGIGIEYCRLGAYDMALECHLQALESHKAIADDFQEARDLTNIGNVYTGVSDYAEALDYFHKAFQIQKRINDLAGTASSLLNMGVANKNLGNYAQSLRQLREALSGFQNVANRSGIADTCSNLGVLFKNIGDLKQAETHHLRAERVHKELGDSPAWAADLANLGVVYALQKKQELALRYFDHAQKTFDKTLDRKQAAIAVFNSAALLVEMNKLDEAAAKLDAASAEFEKLNYTEGIAYCRLARGMIEKRRGKNKEAKQLFKQALEHSAKAGIPELACQCRGALAALLAEEGQADEAVAMYAAAVDQIEKLRRNVGSFQLASAFLAKNAAIYRSMVSLLAQRAKDDPAAASLAYRYIEMGRARGFIDMLVESGIDIRQGADPELLRQEKFILARMAAISSTISSETRLNAAPERIKVLREKLQDTDTDYQKLQIDLKGKCPEYAWLYYPEPLSAQQVQQMPPSDAVLLEYAVDKAKSFLFALTRDDLQVYPLPSEAEIRTATEQLREIVLDRSSRSYVAPAHLLYQMLVAPAAKLLEGKRHIIIVPDGPLHYLAFECLLMEGIPAANAARPDFSRLPYLLRKAAISYAPSATALAEIIRRQKAGSKHKKQMLICADPDYGTTQDEVQLAMRGARSLRTELVRLPYSALEARNVSAVFAPADVLVLDRAAASKTRLKQMDLSVFRYIDFATHAFLDEEYPEFSSIVLAQTGDQDGYLRMQEIFNLKLNADLVCLSACSTACGRLVNGEGMVGISRAFFYAGAQSVTASLWNVNDASTSKLMTELFKALKVQSLPPDEALQQAKLRLIDATGPASFAIVSDKPPARAAREQGVESYGSYSHPFYWAAFVLIGK